MSVLAIIPARGGSKRVPRKNLADCGGRSLLAWTAEAGLGARSVDRVILSTDDGEIAERGRALGLDVPGLRPDAIAEDAAPMLPVLRHVLSEWASGDGVEIVVLLQPSSPLRRAAHIDGAVDLMRREGAETVVSVTDIPHGHHPMKALRIVGGRLVPFLPEAPAQGGSVGMTLDPAFARNGPAIVATLPRLIEEGQLYGEPCLGFAMDALSSVDIDTMDDLWLAEAIIEKRVREGFSP